MTIPFNAGYSSFILSDNALASSTSLIPSDNRKSAAIDLKVNSVGAFSSAGTADSLSIAGQVLTAHASTSTTYGFINGQSTGNIILGSGSGINIGAGTNNIVVGNTIGTTIVTGSNNILFNGAVDSSSAINRIALNGTNTTDNSLFISSAVTSLNASGLSSFDTDSFLVYSGGTIRVASVPLLRVTGGTMTGAINMGGLIVDNLGETNISGDLIRKQDADLMLGGLDPKESCTYATLSNITDFTTQAIVEAALDPVGAVAPTLVDNDRVLVKNQTDTLENGIYRWLTGTLSRAPDQDGTPANEVSGGNFTFVENGDTLENTGWVLQGDVIVIGVDPLVWVQFTGNALIVGGNVGSGAGLYKQKAATLEYRSVVGGSGISSVENTDDITLSSTVTLASAGGTSLVSAGSGATFTTKGLSSGTNMSILSDASTVSIGLEVTGGNVLSIFQYTVNNVNTLYQSFLPSVRTVVAFNSTIKNDIPVTLSSNEFTIPIGTYLINAYVSVWRNNFFLTYVNIGLFDTSDGNMLLSGVGAFYAYPPSVQGVVTVTSPITCSLGLFNTSTGLTASSAFTDSNSDNPVLTETATSLLLSSLANWDSVSSSSFYSLEYSRDNNYIAFVYTWNSNTYLSIIDRSTMTELDNVLVDATSTGGSAVWGYNYTSHIYIATDSWLRVYSFSGSLTLVDTDAGSLYSQTNIDIRAVTLANDIILIGNNINIYSFNGTILQSLSSETAADYIASWNTAGDLVVSMAPDANTINVYSWNGTTTTLLDTSASRGLTGAVACNIAIDPADLYIFAAYSTTTVNRGYDVYAWSGAAVTLALADTVTVILDQLAQNNRGACFDYTNLVCYMYNYDAAGGSAANVTVYSFNDTALATSVLSGTSLSFTSDSTNSATIGASRTNTYLAYTVYDSADIANARIENKFTPYVVPDNSAVACTMTIEQIA